MLCFFQKSVFAFIFLIIIIFSYKISFTHNIIIINYRYWSTKQLHPIFQLRNSYLNNTSRWLLVTPTAFLHLRPVIRTRPSRPSSRIKRGAATRSTWTISWKEAANARKLAPIHISLRETIHLSRHMVPFLDTANPLSLALCHFPHHIYRRRLQRYRRNKHRARFSSRECMRRQKDQGRLDCYGKKI